MLRRILVRKGLAPLLLAAVMAGAQHIDRGLRLVFSQGNLSLNDGAHSEIRGIVVGAERRLRQIKGLPGAGQVCVPNGHPGCGQHRENADEVIVRVFANELARFAVDISAPPGRFCASELRTPERNEWTAK